MEIRTWTPSRRLLLVAGASTLVIAGAGVAYASIPDSKGVIHACRNTSSGVLRVIDTAKKQKCKSTEKPLNWNQKGPRGPQGITTIERVDSSAYITPGATVRLRPQCKPGKIAISGGFTADPELQVRESALQDTNKWSVMAKNTTTTTPARLEAFTLCTPT